MSGRKAKKLRRLVFGDASLKVRFYEPVNVRGTIRCRGDRRRYQDLKVRYKAGLLAL